LDTLRTTYENEKTASAAELRKAVKQAAGKEAALTARVTELESQLARATAETERVRIELSEKMKRLEELEKDREDEWYLRLEDEQKFGPVPLEEVRQWARDCRIGPAHQISRDGKTWRPAPDEPALGMEWQITLADGTAYGPVNILSARQMLEDEVAHPDSMARHASTGQTLPLRGLLPSELSDMQERIQELETELETHPTIQAPPPRRLKAMITNHR
jgi:hypothetical protein